MAAPSLRDAFRVGLGVLASRVSAKTGALLLTLGDAFHERTETDEAELWGPGGWLFRPSNPSPIKNDGTSGASSTGASEALTMRRGDRDVVIGLRDERGQKLAGSLGPGEFCAFAPGPSGSSQGRILGKGDGSVAMYALQGNAPGGASVTIQVLPSGNINIAGPFGGIQIANGKTTVLSANGGGVQLDANGVTLIGQTIIANGSVVLGDASATGVATQVSQLPLMTALAALCTQLASFMAQPLIVTGGAGTSPGCAAAATALAGLAVLPTNYSLAVKAS